MSDVGGNCLATRRRYVQLVSSCRLCLIHFSTFCFLLFYSFECITVKSLSKYSWGYEHETQFRFQAGNTKTKNEKNKKKCKFILRFYENFIFALICFCCYKIWGSTSCKEIWSKYLNTSMRIDTHILRRSFAYFMTFYYIWVGSINNNSRHLNETVCKKNTF